MEQKFGIELYSRLADAVVNMDEDEAVLLAEQVIKEKMDPLMAVENGLSMGMEQAGRLFEEEEYFVPELLLCADAMNAGIEVLKPYFKADKTKEKHKAVIGVIEGDTHDIGKNLVKLMLSSGGFEVIDLGRDVPVNSFVIGAEEEKAEFIMISSLMTTTMEGMKEVVLKLKERGIRDRYRVCVGGGPVSQGFASKIGADGYSANAAGAVRLCRKLTEQKIPQNMFSQIKQVKPIITERGGKVAQA